MTRIRNRVLAAYAGPSIPLAALGLPLVIYLPPYYAGEIGLDLAAVGFVFFLVRALDIPLDPLLGYWMDGTRTRWGRFRPWIVCGGCMLMLATYMVFFAQPGVSIFYLFGWLMLLYTGFSMVNVGHLAWGATLSPDYHQRSRVYGWWSAAYMVGLIGVLMLPAIISTALGGAAPVTMHVMGVFAIVAIPLTILAAVACAPEGPPHGRHHRIAWRDIRRLFASRPLQLLLVADILLHLAPGVTGALFRFTLENLVGFSPRESAVLLLAYFVAGLICLPIWLRLARAIGKQHAAAIAAVLGAATHVAAYFVFDPARPGLSFAAIAASGLSYAAPGFLLRAMLADFGDEERLDGGVDRIGLLNAVMTTAQKLGFALPVGFLFPILSLVGFIAVPGAVNDEDALRWVAIFWITLPVMLLLPAAAVLTRIPLNAARLATTQQALAKSASTTGC